MNRGVRRRVTAAFAISAFLVLVACGSRGEPSTASSVPSVSASRTTTARPTTVVGQDDPYGVVTAEWPTTLGGAARLMDRLPGTLGGEERTPVIASNDWFLVGNIPILAAADESGRVLVGYLSDEVQRVVIAQPATEPLALIWGFLVWGGAPDNCEDPAGSPGLVAAGAFDLEAMQASSEAGGQVWVACTMQKNPDSGNDVEAPDDWAYAVAWTAPGLAYFSAARSAEQRDELLAELVLAAASDAPPSDPNNPLFDLDGPGVWWPGGVLVSCSFLDEGSGVVQFDPASGETTLLYESTCDQVSFSPDRSQMVFDEFSESGDVIRLAVASPDGSGRRVLTDPPVGDAPIYGDGSAVWSPTGEWIAFTRQQSDVYVIHPDGTGLQLVTVGAQPAWSRDGTMLVVTRSESLVAVRVPDGAKAFVIADATSTSGSAGPADSVDALPDLGVTDPAWSPKDEVVAYGLDDSVRLWSPADGDLGPVNALVEAGDLSDPVWSPNGDFLLLESSRFGSVIVEVTTGALHRIGPRPGSGEYPDHTEWLASPPGA